MISDRRTNLRRQIMDFQWTKVETTYLESHGLQIYTLSDTKYGIAMHKMFKEIKDEITKIIQ